MGISLRLDQAIDMEALRRDIFTDLQEVFDVHFVCATFSRRIAEHTGVRIVLMIPDSDEQIYDVWQSEPTGETAQLRWAVDEANIDPFFNRERAIYLDKLERPAAEIINNRLWLLARQFILGIPLVAGQRPYSIGPMAFLALIDPPDATILSSDQFSELAHLATLYLDRAGLRETVDRRTIEFNVIADISHALSATLNVQKIYQLLTGPIRQMLNVETLSVGLIEPVTGDIMFVDQLLGQRFENIPSVRLKRGQGIAGWVAEHQEAVIINDAYSDNRFFSGVDRRSGFRTRSMICIPLKVEARTIGVAQAINRISGNFTDHDLELLQALGGPLAAAIENANLHADVLAEKRRIETIFSSTAEGLVTVNRDGIITRSNSAFGSLLLAGDNDIVGMPLRELLRVRSGDVDQYVRQVVQSTGDSIQWVTDIQQKKDQWLPILVSGARVGGEFGNADEAILAISDLTQIREVERMRDDLFHGIVHELRTPLATILMYARLLRDGKVQQPAKAERFLGVIERESDRLQRMVRQMLDLARLEAKEMQHSPVPVRLNPIFDEVLPSLADRALQKGLLFQQRIESGLPPVLGSEDAYIMILKNLVDNAIKFTPSGSIRLTAWTEEGNVLIEIEDEGIGIPPTAMNNLFKRFYRTETAVEYGIAGTGLGLYMVKQTLQNYNGKIEVSSQVGKGTTFLVRLPAIRI
jgi:two-component system phosphate regulon sensor histidine kinase PhoR